MSKDLIDTKSAKNHNSPVLYLIDGNSLIYRAFYALPDTMQTATGIFTNAIYGFVNILLKIIDDKPDYIAIAFDRPTPTFRHEKYPHYKATRQKQPESLTEQLTQIKEIISAFNIKTFELDGYEADDILATFAVKAEQNDIKVKIFTGDKDILQIVSDKINVVSFIKGISETFVYNPKTILDKFGILPIQIVDYKSLVGDQSDNIPGIKGIGEKTAVGLLQKYHTLEKILEKTDEIAGKVGEKIRNGKEDALLSKKLVMLRKDVPIDLNLENIRYKNPDWTKILPIFEKYEFKSLLKKYGGIETIGLFAKDVLEKAHSQNYKTNYLLANELGKALELIDLLKKCDEFAFDTETTSLNEIDAELVGISFSVFPNSAYFLTKDLFFDEKVKKGIVELFTDNSKLKIGHNIKYDLKVLVKYGIKIEGPLFDTMIASYLLEPTLGKHNLKYLGEKYLGRKMTSFDELLMAQDSNDIKNLDINELKNYACADADVALQLRKILDKKIKEKNLSKVFFEIEMPLIEVLADMELNGVSIDTKKMACLSEEIDKKLKLLEKEIYIICGENFNINSTKQLSKILFDKLNLPVLKKTKTGTSTDADVLEALANDYEIARKLLEYRQLIKLKTTYVDTLPKLINEKTGRIHTSFNQISTATGRLSSSEPNLQNIPVKTEIGQRIRDAFIPRESERLIVSADYSQIELRILAHLSGDDLMVKEFLEGKDIHLATASEIFGVEIDQVSKQMRNFAKTINFGIIYGMSAFGLSKALKIKKTEAEQYISKYFDRYKGVKRFIDKTIDFARENGYCQTIMGRRRYLPDINSRNFSLRQQEERIAVNAPVQGSAADIIKMAMIKIYEEIKKINPPCYMTLQIHDELVFDCHKKNYKELIEIAKNIMTNVFVLKVPLVVNISYGPTWGLDK